ncbi:MAG TPA: iron chelate uptake ABC transporter family permease subunit [Methylomirabilota bacterium]|jgi:zinc/manganese transport system permease protein|nr:iron chelate uptake ABC transporter family permease subunit [Methylomirabilota bacterium]
MLDLLWIPLLACLVLTAIHVYLGLHVLARGVIFVDLALAQVAALGVTVAFLAGHPIQSDAAYWYALAFAVAGATLFSLSRVRHARIPQEAIIGIVYVVSAALTVLVVDRAPQGAEHIKQLLVGSLLTVTPGELARVAALYAVIGVGHALMRRPLLEISFDPEIAAARGRAIQWWDFAFYVTFGVVVTSSVRIAGVLLVFSYLIVPAAVAALLTSSVRGRLAMGWALGAAVSAVGLWASFAWDLPTGATIVATFGVLMAAVAVGLGARALLRGGRDALFAVGIAAGAVVAVAGLLLMAFPRMDHHWLNWLEGGAPALELVFLSPTERQAWRDSAEALARGMAEMRRLATLQDAVRWGRATLGEEQKERLRQFLAARGEITAGDRFVLRTLRDRARERQRYWLGVPMLLGGAVAALALWGRRGGAGVSSMIRPGRAARTAGTRESR